VLTVLGRPVRSLPARSIHPGLGIAPDKGRLTYNANGRKSCRGTYLLPSAAGECSPTHSSVPSDKYETRCQNRGSRSDDPARHPKSFQFWPPIRPKPVKRCRPLSRPTYSSENSGKHFSDLIADLFVRSSGVSNHIISHIELFVQWHLQFFSALEFFLIPAPRSPQSLEPFRFRGVHKDNRITLPPPADFPQ